MSIVSLSTGEPTCTLEDLKAISHANDFSIESGSVNETAFLLFANSFDAVCQTVKDLPEYEDPRLKPGEVHGGKRKYYRPDEKQNPLNAWAQKTSLRSVNPNAAKGPLAGRSVVVKDNVSLPTSVIHEIETAPTLHSSCVASFGEGLRP